MLRYAFFSEFKFGPKFLFWGNSKDMNLLCGVLADFAKGKIEVPDLSSCVSVDGSIIVIRPSPKAYGLQRQTKNKPVFDWWLDK